MEPDTKLNPTQEKQKELLGQELGDQLAKEQAEEAAAKKKQEEEEAAAKAAKEKSKKIVLKNTLGKDVDTKDYFYRTPKTLQKDPNSDTAPIWLHEVIGHPVQREDMLTVFNKIFKPKDGILFYKCDDKEVYIIIVPLKHSSVIGLEFDSVDGEFQKHAISFITEGSVNLDTLKTKLTRVASTIKIEE